MTTLRSLAESYGPHSCMQTKINKEKDVFKSFLFFLTLSVATMIALAAAAPADLKNKNIVLSVYGGLAGALGIGILISGARCYRNNHRLLTTVEKAELEKEQSELVEKWRGFLAQAGSLAYREGITCKEMAEAMGEGSHFADIEHVNRVKSKIALVAMGALVVLLIIFLSLTPANTADKILSRKIVTGTYGGLAGIALLAALYFYRASHRFNHQTLTKKEFEQHKESEQAWYRYATQHRNHTAKVAGGLRLEGGNEGL